MGIFSKMFNLNVEDKHTDIKQINKVKDTGEFCMVVEDVFAITGIGVVVVGEITSGTINLNDIVIINDSSAEVIGIEMSKKQVNFAKKGDKVGLLLSEINQKYIARGDYVKKASL